MWKKTDTQYFWLYILIVLSSFQQLYFFNHEDIL